MTYEINYLAHHGIKGQRWGVRRFQNPDGTLTALGRRRFNTGEARAGKESSSNSPGSKSGTSRRDTAKKVALGIGLTATVATAALVYSNHHTEINASVAKSLKAMPTPKQMGSGIISKGKSAVNAYDNAVYNAGKKALGAPKAATKLANAYGPVVSKAAKELGAKGLSTAKEKGKSYMSLAAETSKSTLDNTINSAVQGIAAAATLGVMYKVATKEAVDKYYTGPGKLPNNKSNNNANQNFATKEKQSQQLKDIQKKHKGNTVKVSLSKKGNKIARVYDSSGREITNYNLGKA